MKSPVGALAVLSVLLASLYAPPAEARFVSCKKVYQTSYAGKPRHKAMATSGGQRPTSSREMSCGWAYGERSKWQAMRLALRNCRIADRNYKNKRDCRIVYAE